MATEPLQEEEQALEEQQEEEVEYDPESDPYAPLATRMGWVPKDQFKGDVSRWKPAEDWIIAGNDIREQTAKELREMKSTIDVMSRTTASIMEDKLAEQREQLVGKLNNAVDDGDTEAAYVLSRKIDNLSKVAQPSDPAAKFAQDNPWFKTEPLATDLAFQTCERLAKLGFSHTQQLEGARKAVEREFPDLFPNQRSAPTPPSVRGPTSRTVAPSNRQKGFHDLPKAAQDIAKDMVDRGRLTSVDEYAAKYWQINGRKA